MCKKGLNKLGEFFKDASYDNEEHNSNAQDKKEVKQENNGERDAFIEELRRHVENDKSDKEAAYIEKHKAKVKTQEEAERDWRKWRGYKQLVNRNYLESIEDDFEKELQEKDR